MPQRSDNDARPLQEQPPQRMLRPEEIAPVSPEITAALKSFFRTHTLNGFPIDVEQGNIRVAGIAARQQEQTAIAPSPSPSMNPSVATGMPGPNFSRPVSEPIPMGRGEGVRNARGLAVGNINPDTGRRVDAVVAKRADPTIHGKSVLPMLIERGDGQDRGIAYLDITMAGPTSTPPEKGSYFLSAPLDGHYSFQIVVDPDNANSVLIYDGLINNELPSGMGGDNYTLSAGQEIWIGCTYDTSTFEINSRFLSTGEPSQEFGSFGIFLGGSTIESLPGGGTKVIPYNSHCGDITIQIVAGNKDGKAAVLPVMCVGEWEEIPES